MSKVSIIYRGTAAHTAERFWKLEFECEHDCTLLLKETENMQTATQPRMNSPALNPFNIKPLMELEVNNRLGTFCLKNTRIGARKENGRSGGYRKPDWTSQMAALKHVLKNETEISLSNPCASSIQIDFADNNLNKDFSKCQLLTGISVHKLCNKNTRHEKHTCRLHAVQSLVYVKHPKYV